MDRQQILNTIKTLAMGKGMYGRLYNRLMENDEWSENFLMEAEEQNFGSPVDFVLWYEC